jgi:hypothetical protein
MIARCCAGPVDAKALRFATGHLSFTAKLDVNIDATLQGLQRDRATTAPADRRPDVRLRVQEA